MSAKQIQKIILVSFIIFLALDIAKVQIFKVNQPPISEEQQKIQQEKEDRIKKEKEDYELRKQKEKKDQESGQQDSNQDDIIQEEEDLDPEEAFERFKQQQKDESLGRKTEQKQKSKSQKKSKKESTKFSYSNPAIITIKLTQAQFKTAYDAVENSIRNEFPSYVEVYAVEQPLPFSKDLMLKAFKGIQYALIAFMLLGDQFFSFMKMNYPSWYLKIKEKKFFFMMASYFVGNTISQTLGNSDAFEVYFADELIFSKLQTGNLISPEALVELINQYI